MSSPDSLSGVWTISEASRLWWQHRCLVRLVMWLEVPMLDPLLRSSFQQSWELAHALEALIASQPKLGGGDREKLA